MCVSVAVRTAAHSVSAPQICFCFYPAPQLLAFVHSIQTVLQAQAAYVAYTNACRMPLPAGKKRKLDAVSSDPVAETDEQLARRLHEELNALTRHSRRGPAPAPVLSTQRSSSGKVAKLPAAGGSNAAVPKAKQQLQEQQLQGSNEEQAEDAQEEGAAAKSDKPRKRSTNRELAMLEVDMVETHVKPVAGLRSKSKDEHDQHDQQQQLQQQQDDHHSAAAKHESSSSLSEQERLAIEHLHAAGVEGKPVNKLLEAAHLAARVSTDQRTIGAIAPCIHVLCLAFMCYGLNAGVHVLVAVAACIV